MFNSLLESPAVAPSHHVADHPQLEEPTLLTQVVREVPRHSMSTRSKHGISKPKQILYVYIQTFSPLPKT